MSAPVTRRPIVVSTHKHEEKRRLLIVKRDLHIIRNCMLGLVTVAALTIGVAAGEILAPTVVAGILALALAPITNRLEKFGLPPSAAALLTAVVAVGIIVAGVTSFAPSATSVVKHAPQIVRSVERKIQPIMNQIATFEKVSQQITRAPGAPAPKTPPAPAAPIVDGTGVITTVALTAPNVLAMILYVTVLTIFLLSERKRYIQQLILLPRSLNGRLRMARIVRDVRHRVSGYLFTLAMINIGLAVTTAIAFTIAGVPNPILWGVAYGVLNFVPIIGPTTIIISSALVGFATADTLAGAFLPPAILLVIDTIEAYFVQPWLLGRRLVVSPIAIFVMIAVLVWMWGAAAAITAVPILIFIHTVLMHQPHLKPFAMFLATESVPRHANRPPPKREPLILKDKPRAAPKADPKLGPASRVP
ncbi:MAG TPA: AI-2E family transporter [Rhizomicrobium sp.]|jgi:predicted PurR-regulated permease PerM